jgi:DNA segregation ATPase FtsK/SpoIIIE, S-DNA-T family
MPSNPPVVLKVRPLQVPQGKAALEEDYSRHHPPEFPRAPRDYNPYPDEEVIIQMPPQVPAPPNTSLLTIIMPLLGVGLMIAASAALASGNATFAFISLPMALVSVIVGGVNHYRGKSKYKKECELRQNKYSEYLVKTSAELKSLANLQRTASLSAHPDLDTCMRYAHERTPTLLWDRENGDPDFLDIRLGIGEALATFRTKIPDPSQFQINPDPLEEKARWFGPAFARVTNMAVALPLQKLGAVGWVGRRDVLINALRASLAHLAAHHAPNEVKIIVLASETEASEWDWARWLPHSWSDGREVRFFAPDKAAQATVLGYLENIMKQRANQQQANNSQQEVLPTPVFVVVWADISLWRGAEAVKFAPVLDLALKRGEKLGVFSLFLSEQISRVPKASQAIVDLNANPSILKFLGTAPQRYPFTPDLLDRANAWHFAQGLAPVRLEEAGGGATNLPATITLMELIGASKMEDIDVIQLWKRSQPHKSLAAPIGVGAGGKRLFLDLHERNHGPHGLVAGTTGSGKTALLSTYLALAAMHYHPHELGFIGIDFKGGDLIRDLKDLPHMIGTLTNLDGSGTDRAIKILRGEIKKRQARFNAAGIGNIYDYQQMHRNQDPDAPEPMPHLVIVCDEFAELKKEQPDFIRELVSISRVGRSLGIHLILATQKPAGVVSEEIWSNSHFHLCLKVASIEDSREMLRRPEAAEITQKGRAYLQVGMNELFELFQAAWGDAPYVPEDALSRQPRIRLVGADGKRDDLWPPVQAGTGTGKTQIQELAEHILAACRKHNIRRLEGIWPPALSEQAGKTLADIAPGAPGWDGTAWRNPATHLQPVLGTRDDPDRQRQELLRIDLSNNGHFALFGSPGSGKTTALQTLIASLACEHTPESVHLYLLDFSGRALTQFENLPHVGAVITLGENERLRRLIALLGQEMERRKKLVENDQNMVNYRRNHPGNKEAEIVVVLDGYSHFTEAFKLQTYTPEVDAIVRLASQGGNLGIHLVLTTDQVKSFPSKILGNIKDVAGTELNDASDYISVVGRTGGLFPPKDSPGRGLIKGAPVMEFQAALPAPTPLELRQMVDAMNQAWKGNRPQQVPALPEIVSLAELLPAGGTHAATTVAGLPVPLALDTAEPSLPPYEISLASGPHFWVSSLPQSGKTSLLQTWLLALAERYPPEVARFYLVDLGWGNFETLKDLPHTLHCMTDPADFKGADLLEQLDGSLNLDASGVKLTAINKSDHPTIVYAVDGMGALQKALADPGALKYRDALHNLLRVKNLRFHMLASGAPPEFAGGAMMNPVGETLRGFQSGFWLGDGGNAEASQFGFQFKPGETLKGLPRGAGFFVNRGKYTPLKFATCLHGTPSLDEWMQMIINRHTP